MTFPTLKHSLALGLLLLLGSAPGAHAQRVKTVFVIAFENHNWSQAASQDSPQAISHNSAAPWLNDLVQGRLSVRVLGKTITSQTAYATHYLNVGAGIHPSEPNYIWSEAGTNADVADDADPYGLGGNHQHISQHLSSYLERAGKTWKAYLEDIDLQGEGPNKTNTVLPPERWLVPLRSFSGKSVHYTNEYNGAHEYAYAAKHTPMVFFDDTAGGGDPSARNPQRLHYAPLQQLKIDLQKSQVAQYNWITPNLYNDAHTPLSEGYTYRGVHYTGDQAGVAQADHFLSVIVPQIMASKAYQQGGAIVIWWDETEGGDTVDYTLPEIVISPLAHPNVNGKPYASVLPMNHSSDLRTIQGIFDLTPDQGFPYLGAAATALGLDDLFSAGAVAAPTH